LGGLQGKDRFLDLFLQVIEELWSTRVSETVSRTLHGDMFVDTHILGDVFFSVALFLSAAIC
jgi:hypothetical protein